MCLIFESFFEPFQYAQPFTFEKSSRTFFSGVCFSAEQPRSSRSSFQRVRELRHARRRRRRLKFNVSARTRRAVHDSRKTKKKNVKKKKTEQGVCVARGERRGLGPSACRRAEEGACLIGQTLEGSFSAVPAPIFAIQLSFCSVCRDLHDCHPFAPFE